MKLSEIVRLAERVTIKSVVPAHELSTEQLVQRIKSYGKTAQESYSLFAAARALKPEINAKKFNEIWNSVGANPYNQFKSINYKATHAPKDKELRDLGMTLMVTEVTPKVVKFVQRYGPGNVGTGSSPASMFKNSYSPVRG